MSINNSFLYERRIEAGLSQSDVANALGYSVQLVSMWESGKNAPSLSVLGKYTSLLQIDLEGIIYSKVIKKNNLCDELSFNAVEFGNNIKRLRKKKNLTQKQLADTLSCHVNQLIKYEKGSSFPSIEQFISLAKLFKVRLDVLYFCLNYEPEDIQKEKKKTKTLLIVLPIITAVCAASLTLGVTLAVTNGTKNNINYPSSEEIEAYHVNWIYPHEITHTLGYYPQSLVSDASLISILDTITDVNEFGYVSYDDNYYEKVQAIVSVPDDNMIGVGASTQIKFNNDEPVINGQIYWFKVEPIKWRAFGEFDNGDTILVSDVTIDAGIIYDDNSYVYKDSLLRNWLNNTFFNKAFYDCKDQLVEKDIYNCQVSDYVSIPYIKYWSSHDVGSSDYARSKGTCIADNNLFSWCIDISQDEEIPFTEPDYRQMLAIHGNSGLVGDIVDNPSYGGVIPLIVIKYEKIYNYQI